MRKNQIKAYNIGANSMQVPTDDDKLKEMKLDLLDSRYEMPTKLEK